MDAHDFPVSELFVERQIENRVQQSLRAMAAEGIDPRSIELDWAKVQRNPTPSRVLSPARFRGDFETKYADLLSDAKPTNAKLKVLWIGCGQKDSLIARSKNLSKLLTKHDVKDVLRATDGVHNYTVWRKYLSEYRPLLFR